MRCFPTAQRGTWDLLPGVCWGIWKMGDWTFGQQGALASLEKAEDWVMKAARSRFIFIALKFSYSNNEYWILLLDLQYIQCLSMYSICIMLKYSWWTKSCTTKDDDYPIVYRVLTIPGGAGFLPSTVWHLIHLVCLSTTSFWPLATLRLSTWKPGIQGGAKSRFSRDLVLGSLAFETKRYITI